MLRATTTVLKGPDLGEHFFSKPLFVVFGEVSAAGLNFVLGASSPARPNRNKKKTKKGSCQPASGPFAVIVGCIYYLSWLLVDQLIGLEFLSKRS